MSLEHLIMLLIKIIIEHLRNKEKQFREMAEQDEKSIDITESEKESQ